MLSFLPSQIKGVLSSLAFVINTVFWCLPLLTLAFIKAAIPFKAVRRSASALMVKIAESWTSMNNLGLALLQDIEWDIKNPLDLKTDRSYLICANHQSWVDIVILQKVFNKRIPFIRFFLKEQLRYVPLLGVAWWALDFPFMKRYSKSYLEQHPEKRGQDLETTRRTCARLKGLHISILNFVEGTRFSEEKHSSQASPYDNLLIPKTGGIAFVINSMGEQFDALIDVTVFYPDGPPTLWGLLSGKLRKVIVCIDSLPIPQEILHGDYHNDTEFRKTVQAWVQEIWRSKDLTLTDLKSHSG